MAEDYAPPAREIDVRRTINGWWQVREVGCRVILSKRNEREARSIAEDLQWAAAVLDKHLPQRGICLLCCTGEDRSHRVIDAIADRYRAGDDEIDLAADYGVDVEAVAACLIWTQPERPRRPSPSDGTSLPSPPSARGSYQASDRGSET